VLSKVRESMPPLRGIIHAAGVLDDRLLSNLNDESFLRVLAPKVQGAWNLHTQTSGLPLDFFVLFSSIASITGSPGQANYAAGNAFLDALAHFRRSQNLPGTSINWGPWGEVGMAARQSRPRASASRAITPIPVTQGLMALERILEADPTQIVIVSAAWAELARSFGGRESMSLISDLLDEEATSLKEETKDAASKELISRKVLMTLDPAERHALMLAHLQKSLAQVMGLEGATLDPEESLNNLGIDSLMALEVQHSLETSLRLKLPMEILMGMPSLNELSRRLLALLTANEREAPQETARAVGATSASLTDPLI
jgi:acyl carrier protein